MFKITVKARKLEWDDNLKNNNFFVQNHQKLKFLLKKILLRNLSLGEEERIC